MNNSKFILNCLLPLFDINYLDNPSKSYRGYQESLYEEINFYLSKLDYDTAVSILENYLPEGHWDYPKEYHDGGEPFAIFLGTRSLFKYLD